MEKCGADDGRATPTISMNPLSDDVFPYRKSGDLLLLQVQGAQEVLGDPWVAWEAVEETEEASPHEGPEVPEGTPPEEETSSTELETGSALIRMYFPWQIDSLLVKSLPFHFEEEACWVLFV